MLTNPFGRKSNKVQKILKLADQLSLSLRENVELIDCDDSLVTFVTESGYVIEGDLDFDTLELSDIKVTSSDIFSDEEQFDNAIHNKISSVLGSLLNDNRKEASSKFNNILNLWEARSKYDRVIQRLEEKKERYNLYASIVESEQFRIIEELKPQLVKFLKENKDELVKYKSIFNSIKLSNTISRAFNLPHMNVQDLHEGSFEVRDLRFDSVYDIVCRQELIKKELLENKKYFSSLWLNSNEVNTLVEFISKDNDEALVENLANIISNNPYFALATKKQLTELLENSLSFQDIDVFSQKEIKEFVSKIYEAKKPVKDLVIENLNDKYGINVQNLKTTPSFNDLGKTQKVVFESLHKLAPRGSALKTALAEFSKILGLHSGVDVIDLNEWLIDVFVDADYSETINETSLLNYMNFEKVAGDLAKIGQVLKMLQAGMGGEAMPEDGQYEADGSAGEDMMAAMAGKQAPMAGKQAPMAPGAEEEMPEEDMGAEEGMEDEAMPEEGEDGDLPEESPEEAAMGAEDDMEAEMGAEGEEGGEDEGNMEEDEFLSYLEDLEGLIDSLKSNMGAGGEEEGMEEEMPEEGEEEEGMEEEMPEEGEEMPEEEGEEEPEEEEEEAMPPKKKSKKPFPPKE